MLPHASSSSCNGINEPPDGTVDVGPENAGICTTLGMHKVDRLPKTFTAPNMPSCPQGVGEGSKRSRFISDFRNLLLSTRRNCV